MVYVLDGRCTTLYKGDYGQTKTYPGAPGEWASRFAAQGAKRICLADLNARKNGRFLQKDLFKEIIGKLEIPVMVEASFPDVDSVKKALDIGAAQVILRSPTYEFAGEAVKTYGPGKIIVQIFARRDELIEPREKKNADDFTDVVDYAEKLIPLGVKTVIYKDRRSEGILTHPNYDEIDRMYLTCGADLAIYSSGGISEIHHLKLLEKIGARGALIGKALFEGTLSLREALAAFD